MTSLANGKFWPPSGGVLGFLGFLTALISFAGGFYAVLSTEGITGEQLTKERALCDQAVSAVLTTKGLGKGLGRIARRL
jgi:hypothetical protein